MSFGDVLYAKLPVPLQHAAVTAYGAYWHWLRFGPGYAEFVRQYRTRDRFTGQQWREWQAERLRALLSIAADHVPYYAQTWSESEKCAARRGELSHLPLLGKDPLRANARAFVRTDRKEKEYVFHTSGSTGTPIASVWTALEYRNALALREVRSANWAGVSFREPRCTFSGRMVEPDSQSKGPYYRFNLVERQAYLSPFHVKLDAVPAYVRALNRHKIVWGTGYAVSFYLLGSFILQSGVERPRLRSIVTTSEKLTEEMRQVIERAFQCRAYEEYSTVENAVFASQCEKGRLHVSSDSGIVEILRPDGTPCAPEEEGEIVATCLMRSYQPLIRFRLGDVGKWSAEPCECGRAMPVLREVVGRIEDVVVTPDGREMVRFHGIFVNLPRVRQGQIVQEALDRIHVKVLPADGFNEDDVREIVTRVQKRLGPQITVVVEKVTEIPRTKAGKYQAVVSLLRENGKTTAQSS